MRTFFDRLYRGSGALLRGIGRGVAGWFREGQGPSDFIARVFFVVVIGALLWGVVETAPVLMFGLSAWWVIAAYRKGKPEAAVPSPQESSEPATEEEPEEDDSPEVLDALRKVAEPHAHLSAVAKALGTDTAHVREVLSRAGIPISDVRMKGRGVSTGVKAEDIPLPSPSPNPSPDPSEPVVGAGQTNNNDTELNATRFPSGVRVISVADPTNPARTHVRVVGPMKP